MRCVASHGRPCWQLGGRVPAVAPCLVACSATLLQRRSWNQQNEAQLRRGPAAPGRARSARPSAGVAGPATVPHAAGSFYAAGGPAPADAVSRGRPGRRSSPAYGPGCLYQWNDQLNVNLALVETSFGRLAARAARAGLCHRTQAVGAELADAYQQPAAADRRPGSLRRSSATRLDRASISWPYDLSLLTDDASCSTSDLRPPSSRHPLAPGPRDEPVTPGVSAGRTRCPRGPGGRPSAGRPRRSP